MKYNLKSPCDECPFRKDSLPGWLGGNTALQTFRHVTNEGDFACHKTRHKKSILMSRCFGSLLFLRKIGKLPKYDVKLSEAISVLNIKHIGNILSLHEFFKHHE